MAVKSFRKLDKALTIASLEYKILSCYDYENFQNSALEINVNGPRLTQTLIFVCLQ